MFFFHFFFNFLIFSILLLFLLFLFIFIAAILFFLWCSFSYTCKQSLGFLKFLFLSLRFCLCNWGPSLYFNISTHTFNIICCYFKIISWFIVWCRLWTSSCCSLLLRSWLSPNSFLNTLKLNIITCVLRCWLLEQWITLRNFCVNPWHSWCFIRLEI